MKILALTAVLAAVALTGCGSATATDSVASDPGSNDDSVFLAIVHDTVPDTAAGDANADDKLVDLGHSICTSLDAGVTMGMLTDLLMRDGAAFIHSGYEAGSLIGASIGSYCPQHSGAAY